MNDKINKCKNDTFEHIREVTKNINIVVKELIDRAEKHDLSKFDKEELEVFASSDQLSGIEYGSKEYKENLDKIQPAIQHHYSKNRHHPEHWPHGIEDMTLIDLIEVLADWKAATRRNKNGNIVKSIELNAQKFNISPQLRKIMENTVREIYE